MNLTNSAAARSARATAGSVANVYVWGGQTLRVPLRPAPAGWGCVGHPEQQLIRWFNRRTAADPGFPVRVRSIFLVKPGRCTACQVALTRFLERYRLGRKLRLLTSGTQAGCSCGCGRCKSKATQPRRLLLDELLGETAQIEEQGGAPAVASELETPLPASSVSPSVVIHPTIDVHAQYSLQRLLSSTDPAARADGAALLAAVRSGKVRGIYKEDQRLPALWAQARGMGWWQLLGNDKRVDAAVLFWTDATTPATLFQYLVVFRDSARSAAARLDPALRGAWQLVQTLAKLKAAHPALTAPQVWSKLTEVPIPSDAAAFTWAILAKATTGV
jgi:hypothetical protein